MELISIEDLALLEVLKRIDTGELDANDSQVIPRLLDDGLITEAPHGRTSLTLAGIELCKSLQHRAAADTQAAKIVQQRGGGSSSGTTSGPAKAEA